MQKHSAFQLRVCWKIRPSPHLIYPSLPPFSQRSYDKSAVGDITDAGSYVRNLCWLTYIPCGSAATEATWGQKERARCPQGARAERVGGHSSGQEHLTHVWGLFVWWQESAHLAISLRRRLLFVLSVCVNYKVWGLFFERERERICMCLKHASWQNETLQG